MSFYVTLPSDSSMQYFPENTVSHFITRLPAPLELKGEWEVGLVEVMYPHAWYNVKDHNNYFSFKIGQSKKERLKIPCGYYETTESILKAITLREFKNKIAFEFCSASSQVSILVSDGATLFLEGGMSELLGYRSNSIITAKSKENTLLSGGKVTDPTADFQTILIYSDIVEPQIVGNVYAPLLKMIKVTGTHGETVINQFDRSHYLPVSRKHIDTIEIDLRLHNGHFVPFERGRSCVKLHFRQKYLS